MTIATMVLLILVVMLVTFVRSGRKHRGIFTKRCRRHCRNIIPDRATVCEFCHRDV